MSPSLALETEQKLPPGLISRFLTVNGIKLHVVEAGPQDGQLIILLHGFPEFWYAWHQHIEPLANAGFHVIAPDQRGYNLSEKPKNASDYCIDNLTQDVEDLIKTLGHKSACIAGHDWGGIVAWSFALRFPERVKRLCILNVPHPLVMKRHLLSNPKQMLKSWYIFMFQIPFLPEAFFKFMNFRTGSRALLGTGRRGTFSEADIEKYRAAWSQPGAINAMINWYRNFLKPLSSPTKSLISAPTLILWGARDAFLNRGMADDSLKLCAQGRLVFFEQATHWVQHEEAASITQLLSEHFH